MRQPCGWPELSRGARRNRALADHLARAGLSRAYGCDAVTYRPAAAAKALDPYAADHLHIPPSTWRFDPSGEAALAALDEVLETVGPETVAAFFCEPVSAAALPAYSPPEAFWRGLDERRRAHGFLVCLDEVVTGLGRTGSWFAAERLPLRPDIIATAKGLGAGYVPIGAMLCTDAVYGAVAEGSRAFELGHTWSGAPLQCAVSLAVIDHLRRHKLVERVAERGPSLLGELRQALAGSDLVREVRGHGFLLGIDYVDPRDGRSFLDPALGVARSIDHEALQRGLLVYSTQPTADGYAGTRRCWPPPSSAPTQSYPRWWSAWPPRWSRSSGRSRKRSAPARAPERRSG